METREIKFRAWSGEEMISPDGIDRNGIAYWKENSIPSATGKVMQFTGLKDKNGKELYFDSDIVKLDGYGEDLFTATKDDFGIPIFIRNNNVMDAQITFQDHFLGTLTSSKTGFEVIGNIYQNADLLTSSL